MKRKGTLIVTAILAGSMLITALGGCTSQSHDVDVGSDISIVTAIQDAEESSKKEDNKAQNSSQMSAAKNLKADNKNESSMTNDKEDSNKEESKATVDDSKVNDSQTSNAENSTNTKPSGNNNSSNTTGGNTTGGNTNSGNTNTSKPSGSGSNNSKPSSGNSTGTGNTGNSGGSNSKPSSDNSKPSVPCHTHSYSSTVTAPTCTSGGYTTYTCSCGSSYTGNQIGALGHSWGGWYTVSEATTSSGGLERHECSRCGATEDRATDPLPATEYYLTAADIEEVRSRLIAIGESYGMTYYPNSNGETWDTPNQIWDITQGREGIMNEMVEYSAGAFEWLLKDDCYGFGIGIKGPGETLTGAYYEVYIYWEG